MSKSIKIIFLLVVFLAITAFFDLDSVAICIPWTAEMSRLSRGPLTGGYFGFFFVTVVGSGVLDLPLSPDERK